MSARLCLRRGDVVYRPPTRGGVQPSSLVDEAVHHGAVHKDYLPAGSLEGLDPQQRNVLVLILVLILRINPIMLIVQIAVVGPIGPVVDREDRRDGITGPILLPMLMLEQFVGQFGLFVFKLGPAGRAPLPLAGSCGRDARKGRDSRVGWRGGKGGNLRKVDWGSARNYS